MSTEPFDPIQCHEHARRGHIVWQKSPIPIPKSLPAQITPAPSFTGRLLEKPRRMQAPEEPRLILSLLAPLVCNILTPPRKCHATVNQLCTKVVAPQNVTRQGIVRQSAFGDLRTVNKNRTNPETQFSCFPMCFYVLKETPKHSRTGKLGL
jgi:hypothetical protein